VIRALSRPYACRWGVPVVDRVDTAIFVRTYFVRCMECTYCHDSCCAHGADVDADNVARVEERADDIARFSGIPRESFWTGEWTSDGEMPGGKNTRTAVVDGACVFRNRNDRGCILHTYALDRGIDYHLVKPMVSSLFPITFDGGLLHPSTEIVDGSLRCIDDGPSLYAGVRGEIAWYFGDPLVAELDVVQSAVLAENAPAK
jgi:hypothetical protein